MLSFDSRYVFCAVVSNYTVAQSSVIDVWWYFADVWTYYL